MPKSFVVEGRLSTSGGGFAADGDYGLSFALYTTEKAAAPFWQESNVIVKVANGWFSHGLGSKTPLDSAKMNAASALWLGLRVGTETELSRQRLHSVTSTLIAQSARALRCTGCVGPAAMKFDDNVDLGDKRLKAKTITTTTVAANVVHAQIFIGDGSKITGLKMPAGTCPGGEVLTGIQPDGTLKCGTTAASLPKDGLDEISNGVLKNHFIKTFEQPTSDKGKSIPDATGVDLVSTITIANIGTTEEFFKVSIDLRNSDLSTVSIKLLTPNDKKNGVILCDPCGKPGQKLLKTTFPVPQAVKTGDLKQWIGKNPGGTWNLKITDTKFCVAQLDALNCDPKNLTDGVLNAWSISTQVLSNRSVQVTGDMIVTGNVQLAVVKPKEANPLFPRGSTPILYGYQLDRMSGAVSYNPQFAYAHNVATSGAGLHQAVRKVLYAGPNGNIIKQIGGLTYRTNDRSQQVMVVFIKNTTATAIKHRVYFHFASGSSNYAGLALNGTNLWSYTSNNNTSSNVLVSFPPKQSSAMVLKTGSVQRLVSGHPHYRYYSRGVIGYYNNAFKLPAGLEIDYDRYTQWALGK